jgi:hypothetical protein
VKRSVAALAAAVASPACTCSRTLPQRSGSQLALAEALTLLPMRPGNATLVLALADFDRVAARPADSVGKYAACACAIAARAWS